MERRPARLEPPEDLDALATALIGAAIEAHRHLGPSVRVVKEGIQRVTCSYP
jgi:hypothetical protein